MKIITYFIVLILSGCALTPTQRKVVTAGALVVAAGFIASQGSDSDSHQNISYPASPCQDNPESCR